MKMTVTRIVLTVCVRSSPQNRLVSKKKRFHIICVSQRAACVASNSASRRIVVARSSPLHLAGDPPHPARYTTKTTSLAICATRRASASASRWLPHPLRAWLRTASAKSTRTTSRATCKKPRPTAARWPKTPPNAAWTPNKSKKSTSKTSPAT